ncbi:MAG: hypothetical protein H7A25_19450 [Leptospiraceae bacterium]|nr:hypothetical protein [Leptospiraceae bacterium]
MKKLYLILLIILSLTLFCGQQDNKDKGDKGKDPSLLEVSKQNPTPTGPRTPMSEYTEEAPGEWEKFKETHVPQIEYFSERSQNNIKVVLKAEGYDNSHYIERIGIMDRDKRDFDSKALKRGQVPQAELTLKDIPEDLSTVKVYVKCNLHDLWTVPLSKVKELSK